MQGQAQSSAPTSLPTLTTAEQIRELSPDRAVRRYPVRIRAVVTYCDPTNLDYYVQDSTAGIYVNEPQGKFHFSAGTLLEIEGTTEEPDFAPQIGNPHYRVLGVANLPQPQKANLDSLRSTREDSQWVEFEGIVHEASPGLTVGRDAPIPGGMTLDVVGGGGHLTVAVLDPGNLSASGLIDAKVRIRGVATSIFNRKNQLINVQLDVPGAREVIVEEIAPDDPFATPLRSLNSLLAFRAQNSAEHRIRVRGTVTLLRPKGAFIQDGAQGLYLPGAASAQIMPGDRVDVVGFSDIGDYTPVLQQAIFQKFGIAPAPPAVNITAQQAISGAFDTLRVRLDGTLRDEQHSEADRMLVLQDGNALFDARIEEGSAGRWRAPPPGSRLRLTGVCSVSVDRNRVPQSFSILLRSPADVVVLERPTSWTLRNALMMIAMLGAVVLAGAVWVVLLRRRVRAQTRVIQQRLEAEAALEKRYRDVVRAINDTVWDWDPVADHLWWSDSIQNVFGYDAAHVAPNLHWWVERLHPGDVEGIWQRLDSFLASKDEHWLAEYRFRRANGDYARVLARGYAMRDASGKATRVVGVMMDVTAIKRAQEDLKESEVKYRSLVENIPDAVWTADAEGRFSYVNPKFERLSGYTVEEIKQKGVPLFLESVHPGDAAAAAESFASIFTKGEGEIECRVRRKDGEWRWVHVRAVVTYERDGTRYADGLLSDITERKQAEKDLEERTAYLNALVQNSPLGIVAVDQQNRVELCNPAFEQLFGVRHRDIVGSNIDELIAPPELAQEARHYTSRTAAGELVHGTVRRRRKDGTLVDVELYGFPLKLGDRVVGTYGLYQDITERKRADAENCRLAAAVAQAGEGVVITDSRGAIEYVNPAFTRMTGYSAAEVLGQNPRLLKSGKQDPAYYAQFWKTIIKGSIWKGELVNRRKDGTLFPRK
jgi:PAS domain S-box-containing protein